MKRNNYLQKVVLGTFLLSTIFLEGCGLFGGRGEPTLSDRINGSGGELIPFTSVRSDYERYVPAGMVVVPSGTFHMGQADEDVARTQLNMNKQVTISAFFMDQTEVTNNQYRFFMDILTAYSGGDPESEENVETLPGDYEDKVMTKLFTNQSTGEIEIPIYEDVEEKYHPNENRWLEEYAHHMGDPLMEYYYKHPAFDDYPVVGVDWRAAQKFCQWRTYHLSYYKQVQLGETYAAPRFRLPTEAEWEYAARGGRDLAKYPWGGPYLRNTLGCMLANFKPGRGNYYDDGFAYTGPVAQYFPNDFGLYDMAGNVAEWCQDAFGDRSYSVVWDMNPVYDPIPSNEGDPTNNNQNNLRVIRGGSWKDIAYYCETGTRTFQHCDSASTSIGFRCAMTYLGRSAGF